ncbi:MAG: hypothetical protein PWP51_1541 [Clostridiales bacterium]|jgi:hypothetical protein|nr:hypothetical protein [Clostridiales bacterium]MDN5298988.1 hypothetical protein [Clostridiales bacterium]
MISIETMDNFCDEAAMGLRCGIMSCDRAAIRLQ